MPKNKLLSLIIGAVVLLLLAGFMYKTKSAEKNNNSTEEIHPVEGDIRLTVTTTGVIEPQNRLEIKPSINGRIEEISVKEGAKVKKGDILAWMSSTERAALIDASGFQGEEARKYWDEVYKKTPIIAPIDGEIIVRSVEPGQTVTTSDAILVLSDRLIVSAQFDETDIGKVKVGQAAVISLDAYPDDHIGGVVDHIAYESTVINNVTIYDVDIVPQEIPDFFRSGMSANVEVVEGERRGVMIIPCEAIEEAQGAHFVLVKKKRGNLPEKVRIETGLQDEKNVEVVSGLSLNDSVVVKGESFSLKKKKAAGSNPFMPSRKDKK